MPEKKKKKKHWNFECIIAASSLNILFFFFFSMMGLCEHTSPFLINHCRKEARSALLGSLPRRLSQKSFWNLRVNFQVWENLSSYSSPKQTKDKTVKLSAPSFCYIQKLKNGKLRLRTQLVSVIPASAVYKTLKKSSLHTPAQIVTSLCMLGRKYWISFSGILKYL